MTDAVTCPQCHAELPDNAPEGLCPRCVFQACLVPDDAATDRDAPGDAQSRTAAAPQPGGFLPPDADVLGGHFPQLEIHELIGQGGMGAVYRARQAQLDRDVALKVIRPESADDRAFAERFNREARTLARLSHPHIVGVHDFGEVSIPAADAVEPPRTLYYFVMEYVDGANLRELMERGELEPSQCLSLVTQICDGLQFAHEEGVIHRDIKPENILVDRRGRVKIADFGLAKLASSDERDYTLTATHQVMGTPRYMAPEQMAGSRTVDHRADIYSLGVVFYEMLTGEIPAGHFGPPSQRAPTDPRLDAVVMRALAQSSHDRFQSAGEFRESLAVLSPVTSASPQPEACAVPSHSDRGVSTILEREIAAAWQWVVHPEVRTPPSGDSGEPPAFPRWFMSTLALLGAATVLLPWAEVRLDAGTDVSRLEAGARLAAPVTRTVTGTEIWSSLAAGGVCLLIGLILLLKPNRRPPRLILSSVLAVLSIAAVLHTAAFTNEVYSHAGITVPLEVSDRAALRLLGRDSSGDGAFGTSMSDARSRVIDLRVSLRYFEGHAIYQAGFYACLVFASALVLLNAVGVRNAIVNRQPSSQSPEVWTGTPLTSLRFEVPAQSDIDSKVVFHFCGLGYDLIDRQPRTWTFQRGSASAALWASDIRTYPSRLTVQTIGLDSGTLLVNCHWAVRRLGSVISRRDIEALEREGRELQSFLDGNLAQMLDQHSGERTGVAVTANSDAAVHSTDANGGNDGRDVVNRSDPRGEVDVVAVEDELRAPSTALMIVGSLMVAAHGIAAAWIVRREGVNDELLLICGIGVLTGLGMLISAASMKGLRSRVWAQAGIIPGMLPLTPSWVFSIGFCIWAQTQLLEPGVRRAFDQQRRWRRQTREHRRRVRPTSSWLRTMLIVFAVLAAVTAATISLHWLREWA